MPQILEATDSMLYRVQEAVESERDDMLVADDGKSSLCVFAGNGSVSVRKKGKGRGKSSGRRSEADGGIPSAGAAALCANGGALTPLPLSKVPA